MTTTTAPAPEETTVTANSCPTCTITVAGMACFGCGTVQPTEETTVTDPRITDLDERIATVTRRINSGRGGQKLINERYEQLRSLRAQRAALIEETAVTETPARDDDYTPEAMDRDTETDPGRGNPGTLRVRVARTVGWQHTDAVLALIREVAAEELRAIALDVDNETVAAILNDRADTLVQ